MIHFNELRITEDSKHLIIDVSIDPDKCFDDVTLDTIVIDNQTTYVDNGPSSTPILTIDLKEQYDDTLVDNDCVKNYVYAGTLDEGCYIRDDKNARVTINLEDYNILNTDMLFIYVLTEGTPTCNIGKSYILGTVVNLYTIYQKAINYIKETDCECSIPKHFVDFMLKLKALDLCIKTGNYTQAIKYWNKLTLSNNKCCYV